MKYIWKKSYKNFLGGVFEQPYRSNGAKIYLDRDCRDSEIKGAIVRIKKTNAILKRPVNKLFPTEYTYHDTNQTDKAREQKLR